MKDIFYWHNNNYGGFVSKIDVIINCQVRHSFPTLTVSLCLKLRTLYAGNIRYMSMQVHGMSRS